MYVCKNTTSLWCVYHTLERREGFSFTCSVASFYFLPLIMEFLIKITRSTSGWDSSTCFHFWKPMGTACFLPSSMSHAAMAVQRPALASMHCSTSPLSRHWEKTVSQRQTQLTQGTAGMLHSSTKFKLLKFMPFPRFWTRFLFISPLRPFSSLLPLPPCSIAFFLVAKLTLTDLWWLFIKSLNT